MFLKFFVVNRNCNAYVICKLERSRIPNIFETPHIGMQRVSSQKQILPFNVLHLHCCDYYQALWNIIEKMFICSNRSKFVAYKSYLRICECIKPSHKYRLCVLIYSTNIFHILSMPSDKLIHIIYDHGNKVLQNRILHCHLNKIQKPSKE